MAKDEVSQIWEDRAPINAGPIKTMDDLVGVYFGVLPPEFADFFHEEMHVHVVNGVRMAWDDLASLGGKVFPILVRPDNQTPTAKQRAEKIEKIGYGYNEAGRVVGAIDMDLLMKVLMWWMVGVGEAVPMVLPDYERHTPFITFRDPRHYYPPTGWSPYTQAAADDALFAYQITIGELKRRYPDRVQEIDRVLARSTSTQWGLTGTSDSSPVWIGEYYHADSWIVQTLTDEVVTLARSDHEERGHPGIVPVVQAALYSPAQRARSIFADQVSIQAAMARMFSQKLDYADRSLYPIVFTTPLADRLVRVGPWAINEWDPNLGAGQPRAQVIGPTNPIDFDQTMAFTMGLQRMLNRNPESFQGQAPGGRAESAKALAALRGSVEQITIREMLWPPLVQALPKLYAICARMDVRLWPNERKRVAGRRRNKAFSEHYRPKVDLEGHEDDFRIEPGAGLAGYQGTLEIIQLVGAELMDEDEALELLDHVRDADEAKRKIQRFRLEKVLWQDLGARALAPPGTPGKLKAGALARIKELVEKGTDLFDAVGQLERAGELAEPMPEPALAGAGAPVGGPPGLPAELMQMAPTLEVIRGGRT